MEVDMTKKKDTAKGPGAIDVARFFITTRENEGAWFEPEVGGEPAGFELKVLGKGSDTVIAAGAEYLRAHEEAMKLEDPARQQMAERDAVCRRIARSVVGMRGKSGRELELGGKPLDCTPEFFERLMKENADIRLGVLDFSSDPANYMRA